MRFSTMARQLDLALTWYASYRPHTALSGATPAERYTGAVRPPTGPPPRGRPGEPTSALPFAVGVPSPSSPVTAHSSRRGAVNLRDMSGDSEPTRPRGWCSGVNYVVTVEDLRTVIVHRSVPNRARNSQ